MNLTLPSRQVLVVEDNPGEVGLIREAIGHQNNVQLHFVSDVIQARNFLARRAPYEKAPVPGLVILDLNLPIYHGSLLIPEIRNHPILCKIKIVVLTGSVRESEHFHCLLLGANEVYSKPFVFSGLEKLIAKILL